MSKALLCPCEDVTTSEVEHAIAKGSCDLESVKRFTGFGTGMCQGKQCLTAVARFLEEKVPLKAAQVLPFTPRPPLFPTELSHLASASFDPAVAPAGGVPPSLGLTEGALVPEGRVPERAKIVIIGGGIMGLALAWNLAERGETDVVVLERGYLCAGASGRNGGGVRMQWGTPTLIHLARRSIELMGRFARDLGINVWLRQGGYLFLAKSEAVVAKLERSAALHNKHGVPTQILTADAARDVVPQLSMVGVKAAAWNPLDGVIFPWPFLWGYAQAAKKRGVRVETFTRVTGFEQSQGRVRKVVTDRGDIACDTVVLAAGAWSPAVAALAGVRLPNEPHRHEICSSEPLKPFLGPLVSVLDSGLYFSQSMRGELVGGMGDPKEPAGMNLGSTRRFLTRYAQALTEQLPQLGRIKILRQWSGPYDVTPDNSPVLGPTPGLPNLLQLNGFVGHGFMMAPAVAERMAAWMASGASDELFERFTLQRFAEGRLEREDMIIG
ncbi:MAG: FAD-dependent oxidoreductase [Myxococcaceae bacterium]|nr:FAD-dependent oxidoreductase [Myxococcaceae bacterium]